MRTGNIVAPPPLRTFKLYYDSMEAVEHKHTAPEMLLQQSHDFNRAKLLQKCEVVAMSTEDRLSRRCNGICSFYWWLCERGQSLQRSLNAFGATQIRFTDLNEHDAEVPWEPERFPFEDMCGFPPDTITVPDTVAASDVSASQVVPVPCASQVVPVPVPCDSRTSVTTDSESVEVVPTPRKQRAFVFDTVPEAPTATRAQWRLVRKQARQQMYAHIVFESAIPQKKIKIEKPETRLTARKSLMLCCGKCLAKIVLNGHGALICHVSAVGS